MTNKTHRKFFSRIGFSYFALAILVIIFQIIILNIIALINPSFLKNINVLLMISSLCNYILPIPLFYYLIRKLPKSKIEKNKVGIKKFLLYISITITLMFAGNIIGLIITNIIGLIIQNNVVNPVHEVINNTNIWLNILVISIIAPIFEEIFFRKILIDRSIKYGARVSIILSAVLFAFFHGNLNQFFYTFMMGGFFAYVYIKTGRITYPIALHLISNLMGSVVSLAVTKSISNLKVAITMPDLLIVGIYFIALLIIILIGLIALTQISNAKFNGKKTEIELKNRYQTMFLNVGMILFLGYFTFTIIRQIGLI